MKIETRSLIDFNELPWDYFHLWPWEPLIVDDIYYSFDSYGSRITIWAADFTNPMGVDRIGRSDELKSEVYHCYVFGIDEVRNTYRAIGNFLTPYDPYNHFGLAGLCEKKNANFIPLKGFSTYYRLLKDFYTGEVKVKRFIGYPKESNHYREA